MYTYLMVYFSDVIVRGVSLSHLINVKLINEFVTELLHSTPCHK